jgi:glycosyltransferase involved in cell wall biosynthesis
MYCGSCFRDNGLAAELIKRGHDVTLIPVYTPTRTDEENVSRPDVLFGGISVYLQQYSSLFRHTPRFLDRLWDSPRVIEAFSGRGISPDARVLGEMTISTLQGEQGVLRKEFDKLVEWTRDEPPPDVINIPNSLLIAMAKPLKKAFRRPIVCTLQGEELFLSALDVAYRDRAVALIREQIRNVDHFIAVSEYGARFMSDFLRIPEDRLSVVPLGINMTGFERRSREQDEVYRVGYFARVAPEKGLHVLSEAYVELRRRTKNARIALQVAGYLAPNHRDYLEQSHDIVKRAGFGNEFTYHGALDRDGKQAFLRGLDVLSVPATYDEPKGMFLLEAMASGVPVVQPRRGSFTEMVEKTGGGLLVAPDNATALADGLHQLWADRALSARLASNAFDGTRTHYTVAASTIRLVDVYDRVVRRAGVDVPC